MPLLLISLSKEEQTVSYQNEMIALGVRIQQLEHSLEINTLPEFINLNQSDRLKEEQTAKIFEDLQVELSATKSSLVEIIFESVVCLIWFLRKLSPIRMKLLRSLCGIVNQRCPN